MAEGATVGGKHLQDDLPTKIIGRLMRNDFVG